MEMQVFNRGADLVLDAIEGDPELADSTKTQYRRAIKRYMGEGYELDNPAHLREFARTASNTTRSFLSAAIGKVVDMENQVMNEMADPNARNVVELEARMAQASRRLKAINNSIKSEKQEGQRAHVWLSQEQVRELFRVCNSDRDKLVLGLMVGAGLRRREAIELEFSDVKLQPNGDGYRAVLEVDGKGSKKRVVPISAKLFSAIKEWAKEVGGKGRILRSEYGDSLSTTSVYNIVQKYGEKIGEPDLQPHDLRRTYLQLGYTNGVPLSQLQTLAGHSSIETTMKYLNVSLDLSVSACDFVPFE